MRSRFFLAVLPAMLALAGLSCGGGDDDDDALDLNGRWSLTANLTSDPCGFATFNPELQTLTGRVTVQQSGSQLVLTVDEGPQFTGTLSGSSVSFTGSQTEPDPDCTTLTITYSGSGPASDTRVQGTLTLTIRGQAAACSAVNCVMTYTFEMTRI